MLTLPRAAKLVVWTNGWLMGHVPLDTVIERVSGADEPHEVMDLPGHSPGAGLALLLGWLRSAGARGLQLLLPVPGEPLGMAGPVDFNEAAIAATEAVVVLGSPGGLVPDVRPFGPHGDVGHIVTWRWHPGAQASPDTMTLSAADQDLAQALQAAASDMVRLDLASWRAEAADLLTDLRTGLAHDLLPRSLPQRAQALVARALRLSAVVELALSDDGAANSGSAVAARRAALGPLERSVRRALMVGCSAMPDAETTVQPRQHAVRPPG